MSNRYIIPVLPTKVIKTKNLWVFCNKGVTRFYERPVDVKCQTGGDGYWSSCCVEVNHRNISLTTTDSFIFELRVYFDKDQWDTEQIGLIYTDSHWMKDFKKGLAKLGFDKTCLDCVQYSEQGMQGDDYVSLDIIKNKSESSWDPCTEFIKQYFNLLYKKEKKLLDSFADLEILEF